MKVSELRIGNYVISSFGDYISRIDGVNTISARLESGELCNPFHLSPIPLTPEWLEKAGFQDNYPWQKGNFSLDSEDRFIVCDSTGYGIIVASGVEHVHQLQNLIFALTGEELQFKD